jgi:lipid-binding SYLF domain-containing protein
MQGLSQDFQRLTLKEKAMSHYQWTIRSAFFALLSTLAFVAAPAAEAATAEDLTADAKASLQRLYDTNAAAKAVGKSARAILIFPNIVKAGLVFGGAYGEGVLLKNGRAVNYYNSVSGSWGLQAGAQSYSYAVFLMSQKAVDYLEDTHGWEIGVGPTVVIVDEGVAKNLSTTTLKDDAYAFIFGQQGLMAGVSIEGTKVSLIKR